jgi:hypothetical protein
MPSPLRVGIRGADGKTACAAGLPPRSRRLAIRDSATAGGARSSSRSKRITRLLRRVSPDLLRHPDLPRAGAQRRLYAVSYYPCRSGPADAIKAMFLERVDVVALMTGKCTASASPAAVGHRAEPICPAQRASGLHLVQPVPSRPLLLRSLRVAPRIDLDHVAALPGGGQLGECRNRLRAMQFEEGRAYPRQAGMHIELSRSGRPAGS